MSNYLQQMDVRGRDQRENAAALARASRIFGNPRLIAAVAAVVALLGILFALSSTPLYQANMLLQIKRSLPVDGQATAESPASTEVEILRSRSILAHVVEALRLDILVEPKTFPVIGAFLSAHGERLSTPGLFGRGGYLWGREQAHVVEFSVPQPLMRRTFILTASGSGRFTLAQPELGLAAAGKVGQRLRLATPEGEIALRVSELRSRAGGQFHLRRLTRFQAVDRLQRSLVVSETAKQSNVIGLSLKGTEPVMISRILNEIGAQYLRQHADQRAEETRNALAFYNRQLEDSQRRLEQLDARFARTLGSQGTSDPAEESRILSQQSVALQERLAEAQHQQAELSSRYLAQHPAMIVAQERVRRLEANLAAVQARRRTMALAEQELIVVNRDKQTNAEMKAALLGVRQKLDAREAAERIEVRIVDRAEAPVQQVSLGLPAMVMLSCVAGLAAGLLASVVKNAGVRARRSRQVPRYDGQFRLV